jgi:hypothetical protein
MADQEKMPRRMSLEERERAISEGLRVLAPGLAAIPLK